MVLTDKLEAAMMSVAHLAHGSANDENLKVALEFCEEWLNSYENYKQGKIDPEFCAVDAVMHSLKYNKMLLDHQATLMHTIKDDLINYLETKNPKFNSFEDWYRHGNILLGWDEVFFCFENEPDRVQEVGARLLEDQFRRDYNTFIEANQDEIKDYSKSVSNILNQKKEDPLRDKVLESLRNTKNQKDYERVTGLFDMFDQL